MTKINISIPQELLTVIDDEAGELGISRSGLIREASTRYIRSVRSDREAERRRLEIEAALKRMEAVGLAPDTDTTALVHEARAREDDRRG